MDTTKVVPLHAGIQLPALNFFPTRQLKPTNHETPPVTSAPQRAMRSAPLGSLNRFPADYLARAAKVEVSSARRWKRKGRAPAAIVAYLNLIHDCEIGDLAPEWWGWFIRDGKLMNTDGHAYAPGEVWAIGLLHQRIAALEAMVRNLKGELETVREAGRVAKADYALAKAIGQAQAITRVMATVFRDLTHTDDDSAPPALGMEPAINDALAAWCQIEFELVRRAQIPR